MTYKEYIMRRLDGLGVTESDAELLLYREGVSPTRDADIEVDRMPGWYICDKIIWANFSVVRKRVVSEIKEGDFTAKYKSEALDEFCRRMKWEIDIFEQYLIITKP